MKYFTVKKVITLGVIIIFIGASVVVPNIKILGDIENIFSVRAEKVLDGEPFKPTDPIPENNSVNVSINPALSVFVTDPDNDSMNVTFYNATDDVVIDIASNVTNGTRAEGTWPDLEYNITYSWYAVANDSIYENRSDTWTFTTMQENHPPYEPNNPAPENETTNVSIETNLNWMGGDPDPGDTVQYDIHFGTTSPPPLLESNHSDTIYDIPYDLDYHTVYFWKIVAWDSYGASNKSHLWHFTTGEEAGPGTISVNITQPLERKFYFQGEEMFGLLFNTIIYGSLEIQAEVEADNQVDRVEFYVDGPIKKDWVDTDAPFTYAWNSFISGLYTIRVIAYDEFGNNDSDEIKVFKWRAHPVILLAGSAFIIRQLLSGTPFQWTILRGTVFNFRQVGNKFHGRAIRLQYREIAPFTTMASSGTIRLKKISFSKSPFMFSYDVGPVGLTTYLFGIFPGKLNTILK